MSKPRNCFIVPISIFVLFTQLAGGSVIPGRWEKVEGLASGTQIWVVLLSGERFQGTHMAIDTDRIVIQDLSGNSRELPRAAIRKIVQTGERFTDSVWDGLAVGAAVGAGSYLIGHAALCCAPNEAHDAAGAAFFAAIGMGIGALLDATVRSDEQVVYRAR